MPESVSFLRSGIAQLPRNAGKGIHGPSERAVGKVGVFQCSLCIVVAEQPHRGRDALTLQAMAILA